MRLQIIFENSGSASVDRSGNLTKQTSELQLSRENRLVDQSFNQTQSLASFHFELSMLQDKAICAFCCRIAVKSINVPSPWFDILRKFNQNVAND
jgi:hypothetical protein